MLNNNYKYMACAEQAVPAVPGAHKLYLLTGWTLYQATGLRSE